VGLADAHSAAARTLAAEPSPTALRRTLAIFITSAGFGWDAERLACALLDEFESLHELTAAPVKRLRRIAGRDVANLLTAHAELMRHGLLERVQERRIVRCGESCKAFLLEVLSGSVVEQLIAIYLDARCGVIRAETVSLGTPSSTPVDHFAIFARGKELGASGFILAHNHPSRDPDPSRPDRKITWELKGLGDALEMPMLGHYIVAGNEVKLID
jgi:DNA repair protein RadC